MTAKFTYAKLIFLFTVCFLYSSACFANGLPISTMNCHSLVGRINATLPLLGKKDFRCSTPILKSVSSDEKGFYCYIDRQNIYRPANGLIVLNETNDGKTITIGITWEADDKRKTEQVMFVMSSAMIACGLTLDEATQLVESFKQALGKRNRASVWSQNLNRYYSLAVDKMGDGIYCILLIATDGLP